MNWIINAKCRQRITKLVLKRTKKKIRVNLHYETVIIISNWLRSTGGVEVFKFSRNSTR